MWVKTRRFSWWPAQVVDENSVSENCKPRKILKRAVLLRLYGSYKYIYHVEPIKSLMEFKNILEQQKCSCQDMLQKAIDQVTLDLSDESDNNSDSGDLDKRKQWIPKELRKKVEKRSSPSEETNKRSKCKTKQDDAKDECDSPVVDLTTLEKTSELSARRLKVMQSLGLIAPEGSPFYKNRHIQPVA